MDCVDELGACWWELYTIEDDKRVAGGKIEWLGEEPPDNLLAETLNQAQAAGFRIEFLRRRGDDEMLARA